MRSLKRSVEALQANVERAGPAAAISYSLIGSILLLGGGGYGLDRWLGTAPWGLVGGLLLGFVTGMYLLAKEVEAMTSGLAPVIGGMIGPLVAALVTGVFVTRAHRRNPSSVTNLMMTAFLAKAIFFAVYVVVMIKVVGLDLVPFAVSFGVSFIVIYALQATLFARLFRTAQPEAK